ncbi:MAG: hypothetical protein QOE83_1065 [Actinomycetota bacterium]|jgi:cell wall-associated NlpC family hydrolase|nr:hypothetical protein [Actinomycetota bacterium]
MPTVGVAQASTAPTDAERGILAGEMGGGPKPPKPYISPQMQAVRRSITWSDMGNYNWARPAVNYVAESHGWMLDTSADNDGTYRFRPAAIETRKYFARTMVRAFAPGAKVDPSISFKDMDNSSSFFKYANIVQQRGWLLHDGAGNFNPNKAVTMSMVHKALVLALTEHYPALNAAINNLSNLHTADGHHFKIQHNFATTLIGQRIYLRYNNNAQESKDVNPHSKMPRAQVAYSLFMAATAYDAPSGSSQNYTVNNAAAQYSSMVLPHLGNKMTQVVQWGIKYVGYPYVWAGEWGFSAPEPSGLGGQPVPGFDCSGLTWWLLRHDDGGAWNVAPPRPFAGWSLPQRTSADMAANGNRVKFADLHPGDIMFYDWDHNGVVDHVDTYVGAGFSLDSSSGVGGVTFMWTGSGSYADNFTHGRTIVTT